MGAGASLKRDVAEAGATLSVHYIEPPTNPSFVQRLLGRVNDAKRITFHLASSIDEGVHNGFVGLQGRMLTNRNWFAESVKAHRGVRLGPGDAACWQVLFALYSEFTIQARGYARILMMQLAAGAKLPRLFKVKESHAVFGPSYHVQNMELFVAEACSNQGAFMRKYIRNMRHLASVLCNEIFVPPIILVDVNGYRVLCRALPPTLPRRLPSIYLSEYGVAGKTEHDFVRAGVMLQRIGLLRHITKGWDVSVYAHSFLMFSMEDREFNTALLCDDIGSLFCIPLRPESPEGSVPLLQPQTDPLLLDLEEWQWRPELFNYYGDILGSTSADDKLRLLPVCAFVTKIVLPDAMSALAQDESSIFIPLSASSHDVLEKRSLISTELQRHCLNCRLLGITLVYVATTGIGATFKNIIVHEMVARTMRSHWRQYLASDAKQGGRSGGLDIQLSIFLQRIFRNHGNYVSKFLIPSVFEKYATTAIQWVKIANTTRLNVVQAVSSHEDWCSSLHDHKISIIFMQAGISPTVHIDQPNVTLQDLFGVEDVILRFLNLIGASIQNVEALDVFLKLGKFNSSTPTHVPVNISETQHKSLSFEILARIEVDRLTASSIAIFGARYRLNEVLRQLELSSCIIPYPWFGKTLLARTYVEMGQSVGGDMKTASIIAAAINLSQALACNPYQNFLLTALSNFVVNGALEKSNMATKGRPQTHDAKIRLSSSRVLAHNKKVTTPSKASTWEWRYASRDELHEWTLDHLFVLAHTIKDANGFEQPNAWLTHVVGLAVDIVSQACKERISPFCQRGAFDIAGQIFRRVHATMIKWNETTQNFPVLEFMQHLFDEAQSVTPQVLGDPQALQIPRMFENDRQLGILIGYCLIQDREEYSKFRISPRTEFVIHGAIGRCASAPCLETILKLRETSCPEVSLGLDTVSILLTEHANDRLLKLLRKRMQMSRTLVIGSAPHITNQGLSGLLIRSNNLKSISFENCNVANDSLLFKIAPILTAITSLSITSNDAVTDAGARCIQQMTNLMTLDLHGCYQITDSSMTEVVLHCPSLISLNLSGCPCISDMTLLSLAMRCYAVQAPQTFLTQKEPTDLMDDRVQTLYNSDSIGPHEIWPEATSVLQTNNRVVQFDFSGFPDSTKASNPSTISSAKTGTDSFQINPDAEEEDDEGIKMSSKYGGVIKEYIAESTFEPLQLHELPMTDRSDVTILICVHNVFLMEKLFNEVSTLTVTDLYVAATHNNSMGRTEAGKISDQMKFRKHIEIGDIDEVSKRITVSLSAKTSVGASLVYGEVGVSLPKLIDVPGDRFRIKIPLNDGFNAKLLKLKKKKPVIEDQSQEEAYKKGKLTGKKQDMAEQTSVPTIAVIELTIELASPIVIKHRDDAVNPSYSSMLSAFFSQQVTNLSLKLTAAIAKKQSADESASKVPPNFLTQKLQEFLNNDAATDLMHGRTFSMAIDQVEAFVIDDIMDNIDAFGEFQLLEKLQLNQCAGITDAGLMDVLRHTVGLKVLDIASCEHITNSSAVLIGKFFPDLEELNISGCFMITDAGFLHIIDNCFSLKRLNITGCSRITDGQLSGLRDRCTGLTSLSSGGQLVLGPEGILGMITLPCLSFLSMPGASFSEVRVSQQLGAASSLVDLNFSEICNIRDWDVCALFKACISLQTLDLSMCQAISSVAWTTVANNCCQLKVVDMSGSDTFGDEHLLNLLANCRMLQEIRATFCKKVTDASVSAIISQGQALTRLELMGSSISIEGAEELRSSMLDTHIIM